MSGPAPSGMFVPLALLAGSLALLATATRAPADDARGREDDARGRVELEVAGVLPMPEGPAGILVLREKGSETILPLIVPDGREFASGSSGGLLGETIAALGGRVAEVEIDRAEESSAGARVRLAQGGREVELRAVPSESIALAVAAGVPIVTTRRLLDEEGLTPDDLARAHRGAPGEHALRL